MSNYFSETVLMRHLADLAARIVDTSLEWNATGRAYVQIRQLEEHEEYTRSVLSAASEVITAYNQLAYTMRFLSNFRSTKKIREEGITRFDHILYHLENHFIRRTTVFDRTLILVSKVFELGTLPQKNKEGFVLKNRDVSSSSVIEPLKKFQKLVEKDRGFRNIIVHQGRYYHEDLKQNEMIHLVTQTNPDLVPKHFVKRETDELVLKKKNELSVFNQELLTLLLDIFDILDTRFARTFAILHLINKAEARYRNLERNNENKPVTKE